MKLSKSLSMDLSPSAAIISGCHCAAAQLKATKGRLLRSEALWMDWAKSSLPVPLSPTRSTVRSERASSGGRQSEELRPSIWPHGPAGDHDALGVPDAVLDLQSLALDHDEDRVFVQHFTGLEREYIPECPQSLSDSYSFHWVKRY